MRQTDVPPGGRAGLPLLVVVLVVAGCTERPRAPVLRDDPVYQNDREGFRLLAPDGWQQHMRGELPPGKVSKERTLVEYQRTSGTSAASFRVSAIDLPDSANLAAYLSSTPLFGVSKWRVTATTKEVKVGTASGTRYDLTGRSGSEEMALEVVAVRRGERVYLFTSLYAPRDLEVRSQMRQTVAGVVWK